MSYDHLKSIRMKKIIATLACLFFIFDLSSQNKDTSRVLEPDQEFYKQGCKLADSSKYKEAIKVFQKAIKANSVFHQAYNKIAYCKVKLGDFKGAEKDLLKSLKIQPEDYNTIKYLGFVYLEDKRYKDSKFYLDSAKHYLKEEPELNFLLGRLMMEMNDLKSSLNYFNFCLEHKENYGEAYFKRGIVLYRMAKEKKNNSKGIMNSEEGKKMMRNFKLAVNDVTKGFEYFPNDTTNLEAFFVRGESSFEIGDYMTSFKDFNAILKQEPKNIQALMYRGAARLELNDFSGSIDDESKALDLDKNLFQAYNFRGVAKSGLRLHKDAIKDFDEAINLKPNFHSAFTNRASCYYELKNIKKACDDLYKAEGFGSFIATELIEKFCRDIKK